MKQAKSIGIFTFGEGNGGDAWDPDGIHSGITGSEEAVIYMADELAHLGFSVTVLGNPPVGSSHSDPSSNPRYMDHKKDEGECFDIAICWRFAISSPLRARARQVYLWPFDVYPSGVVPEVLAEQADGFDDVLWLSEWQRTHWSSANPRYSPYREIFGCGILTAECPALKQRENPHSCIYGSNYGRGLEILLDIWPTLKILFPRATLDIYYGWRRWGPSPEQAAAIRAKLQATAHLGVTDHGSIGHRELMEAYARASLWTYPCIANETFCITALRAQLAGAIPVIFEGSALSETVRSGYRSSSLENYLPTLIQAMEKAEMVTLRERRRMGDFIRREFTWQIIAKKWEKRFNCFDF